MHDEQQAALDRLADEIRHGGAGLHDHVRAVFGLLGDKWAILILLVLNTGPMRHAELRRTLDAMFPSERISQRILTLKLRGLERLQVIERHVTEAALPRVNYALTSAGVQMTGQVRGIIDWIASDLPPPRTASEDDG
ncbi:helix-turn-helix domain-containing protein [Novosphingobium sp. MMS21-SN21R]|uniref:winged helix-turn-helix transcriptional regulator n=1 Tax=Novosphingobium sp. MMS21-SN21R TaxID=2969298 RepID=UPI0028847725|nr:helix-turn-helix domain-containing protein [Novosphingobium sp. MMS21-SN21R]MDT0510250.1 helix-turn-helix domain-containing protein [Novosphingobium sp. MMS21-SN21R]